ncbi:GspH/FimT family pseudopilin [Pseudoalteromonas pernae]|uniref:GspH/FimT family pseudopilin n=1 Tax=Pseudoalteromonas pernae TaxID=3118054 RepID=UPI00324225A3
MKPNPQIQQRCMGATIIELLVTITIAAILLGITIPSFKTLTSVNRKSNFVNELYRNINSARAFAIYHNEYVRVCPHSSHKCSGNWNDGIMVFVDSNNDGQRSEKEKIIRLMSPPKKGDSLIYPRSGVSFKPTGMLKGFSNGSFVYCSANTSLNQPAIRITVSLQGRVRVKEDSDRCS